MFCKLNYSFYLQYFATLEDQAKEPAPVEPEIPEGTNEPALGIRGDTGEKTNIERMLDLWKRAEELKDKSYCHVLQ